MGWRWRGARQASPDTALVMLSMHEHESYVRAVLRHGAVGYVLKANATAHLAEAVRAAASGRRYLSPPLTERAVDAYARRAQDADRPLDRYARLAISPRTAEAHRATLLRKLQLRSQTDLARDAHERGLLAASGGELGGEAGG